MENLLFGTCSSYYKDIIINKFEGFLWFSVSVDKTKTTVISSFTRVIRPRLNVGKGLIFVSLLHRRLCWDPSCVGGIRVSLVYVGGLGTRVRTLGK